MSNLFLHHARDVSIKVIHCFVALLVVLPVIYLFIFWHRYFLRHVLCSMQYGQCWVKSCGEESKNVLINEYSSGESHAMSTYLNKHVTADNDQWYGKKKAG